MTENYTRDELINMTAETFKSQLSARSYREYIQYRINKHSRREINELLIYYLDSLDNEREQIRLAIGKEISTFAEVIGTTGMLSMPASRWFDFIQAHYTKCDNEVTDRELIDMFQIFSFVMASQCLLDKQIRKDMGIKVGFFK
jgi:hypothetical protein